MKKIIAMILFVFILGSCATKETPLSLEDAIDFFKDQEIHLIKIDDMDHNYAFNKSLNDVNPTLFSVNNNQMLSIYVFPSNFDVDAGIKVFEDITATADLEEHERYSIGNLLIFYILGEFPRDSDVVTAIEAIQ